MGSTLSLDQWLQIGILLATIVPAMLFMHSENIKRGASNTIKLDHLTDMMRKHDKRFRKIKTRLVEVEYVIYGRARPGSPVARPKVRRPQKADA